MKLPTLLFLGILHMGVTAASYAQVPAPSAQYLGRIGLFSDPEHTHRGFSFDGSGANQISNYFDLTDSCYATGHSLRFYFTDTIGQDIWVTNTLTGITKSIGLVTPGGLRSGTIQGITESGKVFGQSAVFLNNGTVPPAFAIGSWLAHAETGFTFRTGFHTAEFTSSTGYQFSDTYGITNAGLAYGVSQRYSGAQNHGQAIWMMNTNGGAHYRVGLFSADYTRADNYQQSFAIGISNAGFVLGGSERFSGNVPKGQTAWIGHGANGGTYPVGLFQPPLYLKPDGFGETVAADITDSGYVIGHSARFNGSADVGYAAWVHHLSTNTVKRLGLTTADYTNSSTSAQISGSSAVSETGHITGTSARFAGSTDLGQAAWVASFADGISVRTGLTTTDFTKSTGYQSSTPWGVTLQGNGYGTSEHYVSDALRGYGAWVFNKSTGTTTRVGLFTGPNYTSADGSSISYFLQNFPASDTGWVLGISNVYIPGGNYLGTIPWAASTATSVTLPLGLFGADYTATDGKTETTVTGFHKDGYAYGVSQRYVSGAPLGQAVWVADFNDTGITERIGFFGTPEFVLANGSENTVIDGSNQHGYVWGYSARAESSGGGSVAWVYNLATGTQQTFKIQVAPDGKTSTQVKGVTTNGLVWGHYVAYDPATSASLGIKNFVWSPAKGIVILEDQFGTALSSNNWTKINRFQLNRHGLIVAQGQRGLNGPTNPGGTGVFRAYFAP